MNETVYQTLRDRVLYLEYKPGEILNEKVLADEFGVSRSPIKDVLNRLEWEQFVRVIPRTGSMVTDIEFTKVMHVFQVRFEIEAFEARLAGEHFSSENIEKLRAINESCKQLIDNKNRKALTDIDDSMRKIIHDAAGNPVLAEVSDRLYSQTLRLWYSVMDKGSWNEEVLSVSKELESIIDCFLSGNGKQFGEIRREQLLAHLLRLRHKFLGTDNT